MTTNTLPNERINSNKLLLHRHKITVVYILPPACFLLKPNQLKVTLHFGLDVTCKTSLTSYTSTQTPTLTDM